MLLLDADDPEAMTYLGVCMIGFNRWSKTKQRWRSASPARDWSNVPFAAIPTNVRADTFISCLPIRQRPVAPQLAPRKEMAQYIVDHPDLFRHALRLLGQGGTEYTSAGER